MHIHQQGIVYLVGAGPGDPGLITLRGLECLQQADLVVHDRLINRFLLTHASQAEWRDVGKQPNHHPVPQAAINALLIEKAHEGKIVVRLKGGDPFVFGRGGEEALALAEAGVPFEIVPGISSAIAVPAYAGIPITHRSVACSAAIITGHRAGCSDDPGAYWRRLAQGSDTLVFLMGVENLGCTVEQLIAGGRSPQTPVAIIAQGTGALQQTITGTLEDILERSAGVCPPAVIVIGEVVKLREQLRWFERPEIRPLFGLRVLNTLPLLPDDKWNGGDSNPRPVRWFSPRFRPPQREFSLKLAALGAEPVELPPNRITPPRETRHLEDAILRLVFHGSASFAWIFFSEPLAVTFFFERLSGMGYDLRILAGVGLGAADQETADRLRSYGLIPDYTGNDRCVPLPPGWEISSLQNRSLLWLGSETKVERQVPGLERCGWRVEMVPVFELQPAKLEPAGPGDLWDATPNVATFFSPQALRGLADLLEGRSLAEALAPMTVACAGCDTLEEAKRLGARIDIVCPQEGLEEMCQALVVYFLQRQLPEHRSFYPGLAIQEIPAD